MNPKVVKMLTMQSLKMQASRGDTPDDATHANHTHRLQHFCNLSTVPQAMMLENQKEATSVQTAISI